MNLKEILNYRQNCLFCQQPLTLSINSNAYHDLTVKLFENGLILKSSRCNDISFNFDGSMQNNNTIGRDYSLYNSAISLNKSCQRCIAEFDPESDTSSSTKTRISNINNKNYSYYFILSYAAARNYQATLDRENIQWHDKETYYHITTSFRDNISYISCGQYAKTLKDVFGLDVSAIDTTSIHNTEQLIKKIKMYMVMS